MGTPILLVVDEDQAVLEALAGDLGPHFGVDYQILAQSSPTRALAVLLARPPCRTQQARAKGTAWGYRGARERHPT